MAALAAATKVGAGPPRRGNSADSSGTRVSGPRRGPSQDSVSNGGGQGGEEEEEERQQQQWLRHQGPAQLHSPGEQEFAAAAALAAAAAAAQQEAEVDADAARRGRRLRAAKRRQHDVAEGSDLEDEGLGLDDPPGGDGGRGGKRRRSGAARVPKVPKGERKYTSSELSIAIFEAEVGPPALQSSALRHAPTPSTCNAQQVSLRQEAELLLAWLGVGPSSSSPVCSSSAPATTAPASDPACFPNTLCCSYPMFLIRAFSTCGWTMPRGSLALAPPHPSKRCVGRDPRLARLGEAPAAGARSPRSLALCPLCTALALAPPAAPAVLPSRAACLACKLAATLLN